MPRQIFSALLLNTNEVTHTVFTGNYDGITKSLKKNYVTRIKTDKRK